MNNQRNWRYCGGVQEFRDSLQGQALEVYLHGQSGLNPLIRVSTTLLEMVCEPCVDYVPWKDEVPEIEVG